jgi:hypothetical protein
MLYCITSPCATSFYSILPILSYSILFYSNPYLSLVALSIHSQSHAVYYYPLLTLSFYGEEEGSVMLHSIRTYFHSFHLHVTYLQSVSLWSKFRSPCCSLDVLLLTTYRLAQSLSLSYYLLQALLYYSRSHLGNCLSFAFLFPFNRSNSIIFHQPLSILCILHHSFERWREGSVTAY